MTTRILVIDDNEDDQRLYLHAFHAYKDFDSFFNLETASSAEAGLLRLSEAAPDLVLLDYHLPDMDGIGFMKQLAASSSRSIPIVMLTGESSPEMAAEMIKNGADDYLMKDTAGHYLRRLPGISKRVVEAHAQRELIRRIKQDADDKFRLLFDLASDCLLLLSPDGRIRDINRIGYERLGYSKGEMLGGHIREFITPEYAAGVQERVVKVLNEELSTVESAFVRKDGSVMPVEVNCRPVELNGEKILYSVIRDITERKRTEAMLRQHKLVIDTSIDGFWMCDMQGHVLEANAAYARMSGYTLKELTGMHISQLEAIEQRPADVQAHIAKLVAQGYDRFETRHRHKDGHEIEIEVSANYMVETGRLFVFCRDISARKQTEAALRRSAANQRAILDNSPYLTWLKDSEGRYITVNRTFAEYHHLQDAEQIIGKTDHGLWPEELAKKIRADDADVLSTRQRQQREEQVFDGEQQIWVETYRAPIIDEHGNVLGTAGFARDVTKRKRAQLETAALLRRNRALMENSQDGIHVLDMQGNVVDANDAFCRMLGYRREEAMALNAADWDAQWSAAELQEQFNQLIGKSSLIETVHRRKDGTLLDVEISVTGVEIDGQVLLFCAGRDITERKATEKQLRWENKTERKRAEIVAQQFGSLLQSSINEIYIFDAGSLHFLLSSKGAKINLGYSSEELYQRTPLDLLPSFTRDEFERLLAKLRNGEQSLLLLETLQRRKNGTTYPVEMRLQLMNGGPAMFLAIVQDVTERRLSEDALRRSAHEIEDLYNHAPCGYHSLDGDGIIRMINNTELEWLGYTREELIGKFRLVDLITPDSLPTFRQTFPQLISSGEIHDVELKLVRKDGTILPVLISATAMYDADGNFIMSRSTAYDMTERKRLERERLDFLDQLEKVSHSLVATQEDTRRRLSRELHDRTSPNLAAIEINLDIIGRSLAGQHSPDIAESLEDTRALIADTTASIREICVEMRPPLLDYAGLPAAMEGYIQQFARRTGLAVQLDCTDRNARYSPELESLLFRIFQEALTNCAKHARATSARVTLCGPSPVCLTICDDGIGFDPAQVGQNGQAGLGLLNMREMTQVAGGRFTLAASAGVGTRISVEIA